MARSFVSQFTDAQLVAMKPGNHLDLAGQWKLWAFVGPPPDSADRNWAQAGIERNTRAAIEAREPVMRAGLDAMIALGMVSGFILLCVPNGWRPQDAVYTFPTDAELADELAKRGL